MEPKQPPPSTGPFPFDHVFAEELHRLRPTVFAAPAADAAPLPGDAGEPERVQALYDQVHAKLNGAEGEPNEPLAALCFSGGGIRSATFNLGVLQALARNKVLPRFDYLSSVSGGGYISGWFQAWRRSEKDAVFDQLGAARASGNPLAPEAEPIDHLREYANYLTPRTGLFSADLWTAVAVIVRNLLLNWLVVIPVLAALVALPQLCLLFVRGPARIDTWYLGLAGLALGLAAHLATFLYREHQLKHTTEAMLARGGAADAGTRAGPGSAASTRQVALMMGPLWLSALAMATAGVWLEREWITRPWPPERLLLAAVGWMVAGPLLSWVVALLVIRPGNAPRRRLFWEFVALAVSGLIAAAALLFGVNRLLLPWLQDHRSAFVALGVPLFLVLHLLSHTLFVALASLSERGSGAHSPTTEMDREWWARYSGWVLVAAVAWLAVSGLVMITPLASAAAGAGIAKWLAGVGGVSGAVVWLVGKSAKTLSGRRDDASGGSKVMEIALVVAVPLFCAVLAMLLALGTIALGRRSISPTLFTDAAPPPVNVGWFLLMIVGLAATGFLAAGVVNVNRFSLQAMYRNRLVRAYLGASNRERSPDPFSGFDPSDDTFLHALWNDKDPRGNRQRPMACINAALNLVSGSDHLAWQQRKAESFSMTPLYCGNFHDGYRRTSEYGGARGMRLGSAVAVSGAAANPNMGYHSSPAVTFLLTLFNARLGAWVGNPGKAGDNTYRKPGPRWALRPLMAELFGQTDDRHPYVNLSDGGHFENLGIYEMVLRRCRFILVSDAAQDADARFADLGNAIRKIRIDFGVPIEFDKTILISPRKELPTALFCARATIGYSAVDATQADGELIYIKPALYGRGKPIPYDVRAYANTSEFFPHETTADQWFDESQFESYRALGLHSVEQISDDGKGGGITGFFESVKTYIEAAEKAELGSKSIPLNVRVLGPDAEATPTGK